MFPEYIVPTTLVSTTRQLVTMELTDPWEDQVEEASKRKPTRYADLQRVCHLDPPQVQTEKASKDGCAHRGAYCEVALLRHGSGV